MHLDSHVCVRLRDFPPPGFVIGAMSGVGVVRRKAIFEKFCLMPLQEVKTESI